MFNWRGGKPTVTLLLCNNKISSKLAKQKWTETPWEPNREIAPEENFQEAKRFGHAHTCSWKEWTIIAKKVRCQESLKNQVTQQNAGLVRCATPANPFPCCLCQTLILCVKKNNNCGLRKEKVMSYCPPQNSLGKYFSVYENELIRVTYHSVNSNVIRRKLTWFVWQFHIMYCCSRVRIMGGNNQKIDPLCSEQFCSLHQA